MSGALLVVSLGVAYVLAILGSAGLAIFGRRFPLSSNLRDLRFAAERLGPLTGYQVWVGSSTLVVLGTAMQFASFGLGWTQPTSYDDCILKYVKSGMGESAVGLLVRSCHEKFAGKSSGLQRPPNERPVTQPELELLTGRASFSYPSYSGTLYNGNAN